MNYLPLFCRQHWSRCMDFGTTSRRQRSHGVKATVIKATVRRQRLGRRSTTVVLYSFIPHANVQNTCLLASGRSISPYMHLLHMDQFCYALWMQGISDFYQLHWVPVVFPGDKLSETEGVIWNAQTTNVIGLQKSEQDFMRAAAFSCGPEQLKMLLS